MGRDTRHSFRFCIGPRPMQRKEYAASIRRIVRQGALLPGIVFLYSIFVAAGAWAYSGSATGSAEGLDPRWLPWVGSWRLVPVAEETADYDLTEQYLLTTSPGDDGNAIIMRGHRAGQVVFEKEIEADGLRRPMDQNDCTGWQSYTWSETGKRLLFEGKSDCPGDLRQAVSGMSFIDGNGDWLDIQLLQSGEKKTITFRRYRNIDAGITAPGQTGADPFRLARVSAGAGFSIDEVIELSGKIDSAVLEAALAEMHQPFPINSKQILRLADSDVPTRIIDLMVALSFPDEFVVEKATISRVPKYTRQVLLDIRPYGCCWPSFHPMYSWCWATSYYSLYDWWYLDRYYWPGWYHSPWLYHSRWWYPDHGGGYGVDTGRLVEGQGYTRVYPDSDNSSVRYARPRNAPTDQSSAGRTASSASSSSSTAVDWSGSSSGSVSNSPSASPGGYSSGSGNGTDETSDPYQ